MRFSAIAFVTALAACSPEPKEQVTTPAPARATTLAVEVVNLIGGKPASHIAVGGKLRVRVPGGDVTASYASGPFSILPSGAGMFAITATGTGTGEVEIETTTGYARFTVTSAPIASVGIVFDTQSKKHATIALLDASGKRLVDASVRIASGSAPVSFLRDVWDRIEFATLPPGDVFVKTDLIGATQAVVLTRADAVSTAGALARR